MELEGLKRVRRCIEQRGAKVRVLVTDRHAQIQKWIREHWPDVTHYFDIWHVAKGIYTFQTNQDCVNSFQIYMLKLIWSIYI